MATLVYVGRAFEGSLLTFALKWATAFIFLSVMENDQSQTSLLVLLKTHCLLEGCLKGKK